MACWLIRGKFKMASESESLRGFNEEEFYRSLLLEETMKEQTKSTIDSIDVYPDPGFVLKSKVATDEGETKVFVNICTSEHVPAPKEISEQELAEILDSEDPMRYRVPLSLGEPHAEMDKSGKGCTVHDIVINPSFLKNVQENTFFRNFFLTVVFQGLEEKYGLELDRNWTVLKNKKCMGKLQRHHIRTKSKPVIMDMSNTETTSDEQGQLQSTDTLKSLSENQTHRAPLVSPVEPSSTEPKYTLIKEPTDGKPEFIVLEIFLPGVKSTKDTCLDVGDGRLILHVNPDKYHLDIDLPHSVDSDSCGAQFNRKTKMLTVTLAVQKIS